MAGFVASLAEDDIVVKNRMILNFRLQGAGRHRL